MAITDFKGPPHVAGGLDGSSWRQMRPEHALRRGMTLLTGFQAVGLGLIHRDLSGPAGVHPSAVGDGRGIWNRWPTPRPWRIAGPGACVAWGWACWAGTACWDWDLGVSTTDVGWGDGVGLGVGEGASVGVGVGEGVGEGWA